MSNKHIKSEKQELEVAVNSVSSALAETTPEAVWELITTNTALLDILSKGNLSPADRDKVIAKAAFSVGIHYACSHLGM